MPHPSLQHPLLNQEFSVLDHGSVTLVDFMGTDDDIVRSARNSYKKGTKHVSNDETLIRFLMRHRHTTPFERCQIALHVKLPIFVERQWARHRTAGWNEVSARYSELPEETYVPEPDDVCVQSSTNKQGRAEPVSDEIYEVFRKNVGVTTGFAFESYRKALSANISRETARINLPLSTYTEKTWWVNLHNLFHFLSLRMDSHAQKEVRVYADVIGNEIISQLYPMAWRAFLDYRLNAVTFSAPELSLLATLLRHPNVAEYIDMMKRAAHNYVWTEERSRERDEFFAKIDKLSHCDEDLQAILKTADPTP